MKTERAAVPCGLGIWGRIGSDGPACVTLKRATESAATTTHVDAQRTSITVSFFLPLLFSTCVYPAEERISYLILAASPGCRARVRSGRILAVHARRTCVKERRRVNSQGANLQAPGRGVGSEQDRRIVSYRIG
jgi:hypothetical protein